MLQSHYPPVMPPFVLIIISFADSLANLFLAYYVFFIIISCYVLTNLALKFFFVVLPLKCQSLHSFLLSSVDTAFNFWRMSLFLTDLSFCFLMLFFLSFQTFSVNWWDTFTWASTFQHCSSWLQAPFLLAVPFIFCEIKILLQLKTLHKTKVNQGRYNSVPAPPLVKLL